jgi:hypothetical protein
MHWNLQVGIWKSELVAGIHKYECDDHQVPNAGVQFC